MLGPIVRSVFQVGDAAAGVVAAAATNVVEAAAAANVVKAAATVANIAVGYTVVPTTATATGAVVDEDSTGDADDLCRHACHDRFRSKFHRTYGPDAPSLILP